MKETPSKKRIGVYICHCGGNISDYVDVEQLRDLVNNEENVVVAKDVMFACADSSQKEMINDIREKNLDGIVVASCSPKLHLHTFRGVAERAGLNPYNYVQVNVREQCSWAHSDQPDDASYKAAGLIRAGIRKVTKSEALENIKITAIKSVLVIGAGVAGMRASVDLARMGNQVYLIEKEDHIGGQLASRGALFPTGETGEKLVKTLYDRIRSMNNITLFTSASLEKVTGSLGNFKAEVHLGSDKKEILTLSAGSVLVTTGYEPYLPKENEFGYKTSPRIVTINDFDKILNAGRKSLTIEGHPVNSVAFIYCVGMRQSKGENKYCSRACCTSAIHTSLTMHEQFPGIRAFHLYRDIRTYGKQEILYEKSSKAGDVYIMYNEKFPPVVEPTPEHIRINVKDYLTMKKNLELDVDLLILVNGMVPRSDSLNVASILKIPVGSDKFFNEIHPKLRPVETVINGVFLGGSCQGPKNIQESVQSSLSAAAKINAIISKGTIELEPTIARINEETCNWCDKCQKVCEYNAIFQIETNGKVVAAVNEAVCTGCGICAPVCPVDAINIAQYSNEEIEGMIDGFMKPVTLETKETAYEESTVVTEHGMKEVPPIWKSILEVIASEPKTIPAIAESLSLDPSLITWHMMTMNKYFFVQPAGMDDNDEYFLYSPKSRAQ
jgi:heterodisulfide reductase subunit A